MNTRTRWLARIGVFATACSVVRCDASATDALAGSGSSVVGGAGHAEAQADAGRTGGHREVGGQAAGGRALLDAQISPADAEGGGPDVGPATDVGRGGAGGAAWQLDGGKGGARADAASWPSEAGLGGLPPVRSQLDGGSDGSSSAADANRADASSPDWDGGASARMAIPLYIWPGEGSEWAKVAAAGAAVSYIIANAGDPGGPGPTADAAYDQAIRNAHQAGQRVVGYVDTSYASRSLTTVQSEIDQWYVFYPELDGIFLDLTPDSATRIADYYRPASDRVRAKPGPHIVIINPGQPQFDEAFMALADIAMSYENPYASTSDGYAPGAFSAPAWSRRYGPERFWHVILEVSDKTSMKNTLDLARTRNVGHVYVTNYADPPAYARLPTYFDDEAAALAP